MHVKPHVSRYKKNLRLVLYRHLILQGTLWRLWAGSVMPTTTFIDKEAKDQTTSPKGDPSLPWRHWGHVGHGRQPSDTGECLHPRLGLRLSFSSTCIRRYAKCDFRCVATLGVKPPPQKKKKKTAPTNRILVRDPVVPNGSYLWADHTQPPSSWAAV